MGRRIDALAIMKSILEAGGDPTAEAVQAYLSILDSIAPEQQSPVVTPRPAAPAAPTGALELTIVEIEDRGKFVRAKVSGLPGKKFPMFVSAWDADADAVRSAGQGSTIRAEVQEKPNPNGKAPFVNLKDVTVTARAATPTATPNDIPF